MLPGGGWTGHEYVRRQSRPPVQAGAPAGAHVRTPSVPMPGQTDRWKDGLHKLIPVRFQSIRHGDTECGRGKGGESQDSIVSSTTLGTQGRNTASTQRGATVSSLDFQSRWSCPSHPRTDVQVVHCRPHRPGDATVNSECPRMVQTRQRDCPPGRVRVWAGPPSLAC